MWKYLAVLLILSGPVWADSGHGGDGKGDNSASSRGAERSGKDKHDPKSAKQLEAAKLDAEYQASVDAYRDYTASYRVGSYFEAERITTQYENDVAKAQFEKTVSGSYRAKEPVADFSQCCPSDEDGDGFVDGTSADPTGPDLGAAQGTQAVQGAEKTSNSTKETRQETISRLDGIYSREEAAFSDFVSSGGKVSSFYGAQALSGEYEAGVREAGLKNYDAKTVSVEPGQVGPTDANGDGWADGMSSDGSGGAISGGAGSASGSGSGSAGTFEGKSGPMGSDDIGGIP